MDTNCCHLCVLQTNQYEVLKVLNQLGGATLLENCNTEWICRFACQWCVEDIIEDQLDRCKSNQVQVGGHREHYLLGVVCSALRRCFIVSFQLTTEGTLYGDRGLWGYINHYGALTGYVNWTCEDHCE